jgi:hypothetical protein
MKKAFLPILFIVGAGYLMIGADLPPQTETVLLPVKKHCSGYTILEAGKGVDCNGDTVRLIKKYGYYELASRTVEPIRSVSN